MEDDGGGVPWKTAALAANQIAECCCKKDGADQEQLQRVILSFRKLLKDAVNLTDSLRVLDHIAYLLTLREPQCNITLRISLLDFLIDVVGGETSKGISCYGKWREIFISHLLTEKVNIFRVNGDILKFDVDNDELANKKAVSCITFVAEMLLHGNSTVMSFEKNFSFEMMGNELLKLKNADQDVINSLFALMTGSHSCNDAVIRYAEVSKILISLIPSISVTLQRCVCESFRVICVAIPHNILLCCHVGLLADIINVLESFGNKAESDVIVCLLSTMEILGSFSITAKELQQLLALFVVNKKLSVYTGRFVQALERMSVSNEGIKPRYFVDFYDAIKSHAILCPSIHKWEGKGLTFHTWLCIDQSLPSPKSIFGHSGPFRHVLYSFQSSTGEGFEAFFTVGGFLVIAVITKKEYLTTTVSSCAFGDCEWHALTIVHQSRHFNKSFVTVYVDGIEIHKSALRYPQTDDLIYPHIGKAIRFNPNFHYHVYNPKPDWTMPDKFDKMNNSSIPAGHQNNVWGDPHILKGQLSAVYLFSECLPMTAIAEMVIAGPNMWFIFSPSLENEKRALNTYLSKIVYHFDAKEIVSKKTEISARVCSTWDIRSSISCLGDVKVLFPILEEIVFKSPKRKPTCQIADDDSEIDIPSVTQSDPSSNLKKSTSFLLPSIDETSHRHNSTGSFVVIPSSSRLSELASSKSLSSEDVWFMVDNTSKRTRSFSNWLGGSHEVNGLAHFFALIRNIITDSADMQKGFIKYQGPEIIGYLLQRCHPQLLSIGFLMTAQSLVEFVYQVNEDIYDCMLRNIFFDFRIWCRADVSVQIAHIQQLSILIKDKPDYFRKHFGIGFLLNSLLVFHIKGKQSTLFSSSSSQTKISAEDRTCLRSGILGLVVFSLKASSSEEELDALASFMCHAGEHVDEAIALIHKLVESAVSIGNNNLLMQISNSKIPICMTRWLVYDVTCTSKLLCLQTLNIILCSSSVSNDVKSKIRLSNVGFSSFATLLSKQPISRKCLLQLLKMAQETDTSGSKSTGLEILRYYDVVLGVVGIIPDLAEQLELCLTIRNSLKANPDSAQHCAKQASWYRVFFSLLNVDNNASDAIDVMGEELVFVVIEIVNTVLWHGLSGSNQQTWEDRGAVFAALRILSSGKRFFIHPLTIERMLYTRCLESTNEALLGSLQPLSVVTQNAVKTIKLVNHFLLRDERHEAVEAREHFLKWDSKLLDKYVSLLSALNVWEDSTEAGTEWKDIIQHVERVLLTCIVLRVPGLMATACKHIKNIFNRHHIDGKSEFCHHVIVMTSACHHITNDPDAMVLAVEALRRHLLRYIPIFHFTNYLPNLSERCKSKEGFMFYIESQEYLTFLTDVCVETSQSFVSSAFETSDIEMGQFWMQWLKSDTSMSQKREMLDAESLLSFSKEIEGTFQETRETSQFKLSEFEAKCQYQIAMIYKSWELQKEMFGIGTEAWNGNENENDSHWKLSFTENVSRMHLKLERNKNFTDYQEASSLQDTDSVAVEQPVVTTPLSALPEGLHVSGSDDLEEDSYPLSDDESNMSEEAYIEQDDPAALEAAIRSGSSNMSSGDEPIIGQYQCTLVHLLDTYKGLLIIKRRKIAFYDETDNRNQGLDSVMHFIININDLRELHPRRHNLQKNSLEFFLLNRTTHFVKFENRKIRDQVYRTILRQKPQNIYYSGIKSPSRMLSISGLTSKWVRREISNFDYLMQLNTIAGRTFNDLAQYPVFPWILADYTSDHLDLDSPESFRDLSKPVGCLIPSREEELKDRYETFFDPTGVTQKSHHFTHYSSPAGVIYYLLRVEPFTSLHIHLQGGRFDCADRQFYSIPATWKSLITHGNDAKELVPEFFYLPEVLTNFNQFNFGALQSGRKISDVDLPPWASDPDDFIYKHRHALESDYVSSNLHKWIDLIFGYKQRGKAAVEAVNIYQSLAYEGAVDLETIEDPLLREAAEGIINNFGQVPSQLLTKPHPCRKEATSSDQNQWNMLKNESTLKLSLIELHSSASPMVTIRTARHHARSLIYRNMPDTMVTVDISGFIGLHSWLVSSPSDTQSFIFGCDPLYNLNSKSRSQQVSLVTDCQCAIELSSKTVICSSDGQLIVASGYWDNTIRIFNQSRKQTTVLCVHRDVVSCLAFDADHNYLISGSVDHTCALFKVMLKNGASVGVESEPEQILHGHCTGVTCVAINSGLDLVVSGDEYGTCLLHTVTDGQLVRSLNTSIHSSSSPISCQLNHVVISDLGKIIFATSSSSKDTNDKEMQTSSLLVYSINGRNLQVVPFSTTIQSLALYDDCLAVGCGNDGMVSFRNINSPSKELISKSLRSKIKCLSFTSSGTHLIIGLNDGSLIVMSPNL